MNANQLKHLQIYCLNYLSNVLNYVFTSTFISIVFQIRAKILKNFIAKKILNLRLLILDEAGDDQTSLVLDDNGLRIAILGWIVSFSVLIYF